jgi:hypothetical protein
MTLSLYATLLSALPIIAILTITKVHMGRSELPALIYG